MFEFLSPCLINHAFTFIRAGKKVPNKACLVVSLGDAYEATKLKKRVSKRGEVMDIGNHFKYQSENTKGKQVSLRSPY